MYLCRNFKLTTMPKFKVERTNTHMDYFIVEAESFEDIKKMWDEDFWFSGQDWEDDDIGNDGISSIVAYEIDEEGDIIDELTLLG